MGYSAIKGRKEKLTDRKKESEDKEGIGDGDKRMVGKSSDRSKNDRPSRG